MIILLAREDLSEIDRIILSFISKAEEKGYGYVLFTQRITPSKAMKRYRDEIRERTRSPLFF